MEANILVVEDEKGIRDAITIYLKNQGYHVYEAENGAQGLEMVENHIIHLAIVDIMMPVMDGITMTMKLREKYDFPLIFLSAKSEDIDKITGLNIGADDYITKPFGSMELLARVHSNLRRYEQILQLKKAASASQKRNRRSAYADSRRTGTGFVYKTADGGRKKCKADTKRIRDFGAFNAFTGQGLFGRTDL